MDSDDKTNIRTEEMKLLVVIPALNEEESISSTIEQTLASREIILSQTPVTEVAITVVSDGSTDRTPELARAFGGRIKLIEFPENRGYGAAIKEAWRQSDADLLSFLDADGTCNPRFFADLCNRLIQQDLDVVCGSRLHAGSRMQLIRRIGNTIFAILVTVFSSARVRDTASGNARRTPVESVEALSASEWLALHTRHVRPCIVEPRGENRRVGHAVSGSNR